MDFIFLRHIFSIIHMWSYKWHFCSVIKYIMMDPRIRISGRTAVVLGVERLHGAAVRCTDLRGGAALCAAALAAEGETSISDITHIDRGYQSIEDDLAALGADIRRVEGTASP